MALSASRSFRGWGRSASSRTIIGRSGAIGKCSSWGRDLNSLQIFFTSSIEGFFVPNSMLTQAVWPSLTGTLLQWALMQKGYEIKRLVVSTMQAVSGAGYPGVPSLDIIDNIVPYIGGEEEKSETEPLKILGTINNEGVLVNATEPKISAHCNRVPVSDGHSACVSLEFGTKKPSIEEVKKIWTEFKAMPQEEHFPTAPQQPIIVREEADRPQPKKDRDADKAMAVVVGRIRPCTVFDLRFVGLSHNTIRGAAGGGVLSAELLKHKGYI